MRRGFLHQASLLPMGELDPGAPGAAITLALCGAEEHEPPCPLAPHHTAATPDGGLLRLRIVFSTEPASEGDVRSRIAAALLAGTCTPPGRPAAQWLLVAEHPGVLDEEETALARRLADA